ncbi:MAG TPA: Ku protein [Acholeplasmataceae bacterium]|jgi:DNA end-binding protein Ku|nr:Ku protein [Acholeplasmataceae bacterium]
MGKSYKGAISFGLIYIPISLYNAVRSNTISFNLIDKETMSRIHYLKTCANCEGKVVDNKDIVKGYEYEENKYVIFDNEDFEKLKSKRDKTIVIEQFVNLSDIDPVYYNKPYYVVPEKGAEKAYDLLKKAMERSKKVGIAKAVLGSKESLIAIRVKNDIMYLYTMNFHEEITDPPYIAPKLKTNKKELELATALINSMKRSFNPEEYVDEYRRKIIKAIEAKIAGQEIVVKEDEDINPAIDLMVALEKSLEQMRDSLNK